MSDLAQYLRSSSDRLQREPWGDAQRLAQELYSILKSSPSPTQGSLSIDLGTVQFQTSDAPDISLPLIDFDALTPSGVLADQQTELKGADNEQRDNSRIFTRRSVLVAQIQSKSNTGTYTCRVYPNGPGGDFETVTGVTEVQSRDVADDTWILMARIDTLRFIETSLTSGNSITNSRIELVNRLEFFSEGNAPRPYVPWGSGAGLNLAPARPHVLSHVVQTVQDGIDGVQHASDIFQYNTPLLWLPDDRSRLYPTLGSAFVGSSGPTFGAVTVTFDPVAGTIAMAYTGGSPAGYSVSRNAQAWATSAAVGVATPPGVERMSWPANAWNTGVVYFTTAGGWVVLQNALTLSWQSLGGSPAVYTRSFLGFG